ncbi:MAG: 5'/3'-nucleotidase SurE [Solirubrobacterales bacterium]
MTKLRALLTNDDGVSREGLQTLRDELIARDFAATVIAPAENQSGRARAVSCFGPIELERLHDDPENPIYSCAGTPVDCVRVAVLSDLLDPFDVVVSGINHGVNLGDDATFSGTLGAALEGALLGIPSIAFSQQDDAGDWSLISHGHHHFRLAGFAAEMARLRFDADLPADVAVNVNFPHELAEPAVEVSCFGHLAYPAGWTPAEPKGDGKWDVWPYAHPERPDPEVILAEGTDVAGLAGGRVTMTAVSTDWSRAEVDAHREAVEQLGSRSQVVLGDSLAAGGSVSG